MGKTETKSDKNLARYLHARVIAGRGEGGRGAKGISNGRVICDSEGRRHASYVCAKRVLELYWRCITHKLKTLRSTGKGRARVTQSHSERAKQIPCTVFEIVGLLSNRWTHDCEISVQRFRDRASIIRHVHANIAPGFYPISFLFFP